MFLYKNIEVNSDIHEGDSVDLVLIFIELNECIF